MNSVEHHSSTTSTSHERREQSNRSNERTSLLDNTHNHNSRNTNNNFIAHSFLPSFNVAHEGESGRSGFHIRHLAFVLWKSSSQVSSLVNILWPFAFLAIIIHYIPTASHHGKSIFAFSYIGMIPAANLLGFAGQEFARKMPKVAGILVETALGSIVEIVLFMILIAKHTTNEGSSEDGNLIPVIQAAVLGSILTNLLLCLGLCFFVGGLRKTVQKFHAAVSEVGCGLLLVAAFGLLIPSAFYSALKQETVPSESGKPGREAFTQERLQHDIVKISQWTSIVLMISFVAYIIYQSTTSHSIFDEILEADEQADTDREADLTKPKFTLTETAIAILLSLTLVSILLIFLVEQIPTVVSSGIPDQFLGLILLPLVEKAAEHLTAVDEAYDGQMNFALYHCLGPSIQTALFNAPLVVVVAWMMDKPMDLNFEIFMIALLVLSILVVGSFLRDNESNWLEGFLLVIIYVIIAIAAWYYPDPELATSNGIQTGFDGVNPITAEEVLVVRQFLSRMQS